MKDKDQDTSSLAPSARSRALFDRSVIDIDPATANRLRVMRRDALSGRSGFGLRGMRPAALLASSLVVAGLAWWLPHGQAPARQAVAVTEATTDASLAMPVDDDQEAVYAWLGEAPVAVDAQPGGSL